MGYPKVTAENGTLSTPLIQEDGSLRKLDSIQTPIGVAFPSVYGDSQAIGIAFYISGFTSTYYIQNSRRLLQIQNEALPFTKAGPSMVQPMPRPHDVIPDPTGCHMLIADLGADSVGIFKISYEPVTLLKLIEATPLKLAPGSGPRHGAFVKLEAQTYFYILNQFCNTLAGFKVAFINDQNLEFHHVCQANLLLKMDGSVIQKAIIASELQVSPDNRPLVASLRKDFSFNIPPLLDPTKTIPSDTLITYSINRSSGELTLANAVAAGGSSPRQFLLNRAVDKIAVGVKNDGCVVEFDRDVRTVKLGELLAAVGELEEGGVVRTNWDEEEVP